jgi:hypothetical protein
MRGGAPDKIGLWTDGSYGLIKHDHTNLVSWTEDKIKSIVSNYEYILPADVGDILYANKLSGSYGNFDDSFILLPQINCGEWYCKIIDYNEFVPKNSTIYEQICNGQVKGVTYMPYRLFDVNNIKDYSELHELVYEANLGYRKFALKSTTGSGSRGVWLIDSDRLHLGGKYISKLGDKDFIEFVKFCKDNSAKAMIQELIPNDPKLTKVNVDFVIRDGKLLGYKWDKTDPTAVFTNWNFGWFTTTGYTDMIMKNISEFLLERGIWNAIMNFEAFTDYQSNLYLVEFNWRYSNSMFEGQAEGVDLIGHYLRGEEFKFPYEERKFVRYWQCKYYDELV